jgi:AcrR family transcriptional regulator
LQKIMTAIARQTIRYERKREAILDAAAMLFNARGLGGTIIADVAQSVGLTTTSVTYYYRRKEDLAAACLLRAIEVMDALVTRAEADGGTAQGRLTRFLEFYFTSLADTAEGRAPEGINFWDLRALTGQRQAEASMAAFVALFRRFRELFRAPSGPTFSRIEQNARAHLIFSAVIRAKGWARRYETEDYPRAAARMADILINGVAAEGRAWAPAMLELAMPGSPDAGEVSRDAFLKAATELVNEYGYRGASVDRISARLKVTKGSFYHHNDTKDDLVAACFGRTFDVIRRAHRASATVADDGWNRLCAVCAALVRHQFSEDGPLLRLSALSATAEAVRPGLLAEIGRLSEKTAGLLADGIADGSIRAVDATIAAELVNGMINAAAELSKWSPAATIDTAADLFVKPLMFGVFSPPGQLSN